uniref:Zinc finger protein n=1 Tax=Sipha flava TaxID=143950 RepID=A0A2S2Q2P7_9HEMI
MVSYQRRDKEKMSCSPAATTLCLIMLRRFNTLDTQNDENFLSCPLCDVACSRGELKDHIQRIHIPEETKYRCEYCPFWSEEKKAMLDHMMFAHEFDDGSVNTDFNASDINYQIGQRDESNSNSIIEYEDNDERIEECGSSNDTSVNMEMFDSGSGDNTTMISNMEVVYGTNDENLIAETVECKLGFDDNDGDTSVNTTSKSFEKTRSDNNVNDSMVTCEYSDGEDDEHAEDDGINTKTNTSAADPVSEDTNDSPEEGADQLFECTECWYFSNNKRDINAHKQLHAKRGALYSCTQCVFNVTKSAVLYNHYRYGHVVEEPELQYPEDSVVRAGQRDMILKNSEKDMDDKTFNAAAEAENTSGPPMVWSYNKSSVPTFFKVFKCRYCPHTNRRRHNTIEHERMHSDHPDHQHHREQQQRAAGSSITQSPMHPCKRCTYVCNNAGVLASHTKVHSTSYGCATVGFYDGSISDSVQLQALEHVIKLEQQLLLDKDYDDNYDNDSQDDTKYTEFDDPELKFCPYCPARFFFHFDLRCHIRFHKSYGWPHSCDCCSFTARSQNHVSSHEVVHCDEYAQRTEELLNSGYPVSQQFPRPSEYTESVTDDSFSCPRQRSWSLPQSVKNDDKTDSLDSDGRQSRRIKRLRNSDITAEPSSSPEKQELAEKTTKRRRRSTAIDMTANTTNTKTSPHMPLPVKTGVAMKTTSSAANKTLNNTKAVALKSASNSATTAKTKLTKSNYVRQFMCDQCPGRFFKSAALQYHKTLHGGPGRHHCRRCNYAVSTYGNLIRHEAVHRDLPPREKVKFVTSKVPKSKDTSTADNSASSATTTMLSPQELPPLVTNNTNDNYDDSNSSAAAQDDEFPLDPEFGTIMLGNPDFYYPTTLKNGVAQPKRYKCPKCPTAFDKRDQYAMHLTLHGAQDKYRCDKCDYSVKYTANFVQHQRKHARDAEIRKNFKQEAERSKMIAAQEKASNALRDRRRSTTNDRQLVTLEPRETKFRNEISDRQTAYELNAAYGPTSIVKDGSGETLALYRCTHCPYETDLRVQLERHIAHHQDTKSGRNSVDGSSPTATKRSWKRACRFCSYRTYGESDLTEHTRVHFLRSTGVVLASLAAVAANGKVSGNDIIDSSDHVEFHGKRIVYNNRRRENDSEEKDDDNAVDNDVSQPVVDEDPFFVFKDRGTDYAIGTGAGSNNTTTGKPSRFSPEVKRPKMLIDINDNRTSGCATDKTEKEKTSFVRFINGGKRLELLDNRNEVDTPPPIEIEVKKKKSKK